MAKVVLDHTSGYPNLFVRRDFTDFSCDFVLRLLADGTSVEDNNICLVDGIDGLHTDVRQDGSDAGCIGIVHLTTEDDYVECGHILRKITKVMI